MTREKRLLFSAMLMKLSQLRNQKFTLEAFESDVVWAQAQLTMQPPLPVEPGFEALPPLPVEPGIKPLPPLPVEPGFEALPPLPVEPGVGPLPPLPVEPGFGAQPPLPVEPGIKPLPPLPVEPGFEALPPLPVEPGVGPLPPLPVEPGFEPLPPLPVEAGCGAQPPLPVEPGFEALPTLPIEPDSGTLRPLPVEPGFGAQLPLSIEPCFGALPPLPVEPGFEPLPPLPVEPGFGAQPPLPVEPGFETLPPLPVEPGFEVLPPLPVEPGFEPLPPLPVEPGFGALPPLQVEPGFEALPPLPVEPGFETLLPLPVEPGFEALPPLQVEPDFEALPPLPVEPGFEALPPLPVEPGFEPLPPLPVEPGFGPQPPLPVEAGFGALPTLAAKRQRETPPLPSMDLPQEPCSYQSSYYRHLSATGRKDQKDILGNNMYSSDEEDSDNSFLDPTYQITDESETSSFCDENSGQSSTDVLNSKNNVMVKEKRQQEFPKLKALKKAKVAVVREDNIDECAKSAPKHLDPQEKVRVKNKGRYSTRGQKRAKVRKVTEEIPDSGEDSETSFIFDGPLAIAGVHEDILSISEDEDEDDIDIHEDEISRDISNNNIYVKIVLKSETSKTGRKKKSTRVYNSRHECPVCYQMFINWAKHIAQHTDNSEVKKLCDMKKGPERKKKMACLRRRTDHAHNLRVIEMKKGEIILGRRFTGKFDLRLFGPCPHCEEWVKISIIERHQKVCPAGSGQTESRGVLLTESAVMCGRLSNKASTALRKEVFTIMLQDEVGILAREDPLIIVNGNQWLMRNIGNEINRGYYTSSAMRLTARLLQALRKITPQPEGKAGLIDYLKPEFFDDVVQATMSCAAVDMDDDEDLKTPSNAIKLGFEIKRLIGAKKGLAIRARDNNMKEECRDFLELMASEWATRVTKLARVTLAERLYNRAKELPQPKDVKKLSDYISQELATVDLSDHTYDTFRRVVQLCEAKLVSYNRRRSGEIQAVKLSYYAKRKTGVTDLDLEMTRELTEWERHLLHSQEVMEIRGKTGRGVPVLLPQELREHMSYLSSSTIRSAAGIESSNKFMFAARGSGVVRAYESLSAIASEAGLEKPEMITSVHLRKYMATVSQVLNMSDTEAKWLFNHLGHTENVHLLHYRSRSDVIERVEIAKLCLIQDQNMVHQFVGKKLENIQFSDVVYPGVAAPVPQAPSNGITVVSNLPAVSEDAVPGLYDAMEDEVSGENISDDDSDAVMHPVKGRRKTKKRKGLKVPVVRIKWTQADEKELRHLFREFFHTEECPGQQDCERAMKASKKNKGFVWNRKRDSIKKKVNNMILKEKKH